MDGRHPGAPHGAGSVLAEVLRDQRSLADRVLDAVKDGPAYARASGAALAEAIRGDRVPDREDCLAVLLWLLEVVQRGRAPVRPEPPRTPEPRREPGVVSRRSRSRVSPPPEVVSEEEVEDAEEAARAEKLLRRLGVQGRKMRVTTDRSGRRVLVIDPPKYREPLG